MVNVRQVHNLFAHSVFDVFIVFARQHLVNTFFCLDVDGISTPVLAHPHQRQQLLDSLFGIRSIVLFKRLYFGEHLRKQIGKIVLFGVLLQCLGYFHFVFHRIKNMPQRHFFFASEKTCINTTFQQSTKHCCPRFITGIILVLNIVPTIRIQVFALLLFDFEV